MENMIIWRAVNQSLLADAIQCLTGSNNVIHSEYLASAVAEKCHFKLPRFFRH